MHTVKLSLSRSRVLPLCCDVWSILFSSEVVLGATLLSNDLGGKAIGGWKDAPPSSQVGIDVTCYTNH